MYSEKLVERARRYDTRSTHLFGWVARLACEADNMPADMPILKKCKTIGKFIAGFCATLPVAPLIVIPEHQFRRTLAKELDVERDKVCIHDFGWPSRPVYQTQYRLPDSAQFQDSRAIAQMIIRAENITSELTGQQETNSSVK